MKIPAASVCAGWPLIIAPLLEYLAIAPFGSDIFLWWGVLLIFLPLLAALLGFVVFAFSLFLPSSAWICPVFIDRLRALHRRHVRRIVDRAVHPHGGVSRFGGTTTTSARRPLFLTGNPWVLSVFTPSGGINFDQFLYFPRRNYPERGYGGSLERVGNWAYVHE